MTFRGPVDTVLSIGGRNLTGMGMLMNIQEQPFTHKTEEVDLIGAPYIFQAKTGKKAWRFSVGGYVRDDAGSVLSLSNAAETAREPHSAIYARFGDNPGAHADIIPAVIASGGDFDLPRDGLIKVNNLQWQLASKDVLLDGALIANAVGVAASAAPYAALRHDFGAAHTGGFTVAFHISNVVWDGRDPAATGPVHAQRGYPRLYRLDARDGAERAPLPPGGRHPLRRGRGTDRQPFPLGRYRHHLDGRRGRPSRRHHRSDLPRVGATHHGI